MSNCSTYLAGGALADALHVVQLVEQRDHVQLRALQIHDAITLRQLLVNALLVGAQADAGAAVHAQAERRAVVGEDLVEQVVIGERLVGGDFLAPEEGFHLALLPVRAKLAVFFNLRQVAELGVQRIAFQQHLAPFLVLRGTAQGRALGFAPERNVLPVQVRRRLGAELLEITDVVRAAHEQAGDGRLQPGERQVGTGILRRQEQLNAVGHRRRDDDDLDDPGGHRLGARAGQARDVNPLADREGTDIAGDVGGGTHVHLPVGAGRRAVLGVPVAVVDRRVLPGHHERLDHPLAGINLARPHLLVDVHLVRHQEVVQPVLDGAAHLDFHVVLEQRPHHEVVPRFGVNAQVRNGHRLRGTDRYGAALLDVGGEVRRALREGVGRQKQVVDDQLLAIFLLGRAHDPLMKQGYVTNPCQRKRLSHFWGRADQPSPQVWTTPHRSFPGNGFPRLPPPPVWQQVWRRAWQAAFPRHFP